MKAEIGILRDDELLIKRCSYLYSGLLNVCVLECSPTSWLLRAWQGR